MKTIFPKIEIHPLFYLFALLSITTAHFFSFLEFTSVILFHELGHVLASFLFHWKIKRVLILPLGGMTEFQVDLNKPIYQEFVIVIMGPIFQILFYSFYPTVYHYPILFFNLLPIYPLDGSKICFLFFNILISYYQSYRFLTIISSITIFILLFLEHSFLFLLMSAYLLVQLLSYWKNIDMSFSFFIWERYQKEYPYYRKKLMIHKKLKKLKRSVKHYFLINGHILSEKEVLKEEFSSKNLKSRKTIE